MILNGWRRLWTVASAVWVVGLAWQLVALRSEGNMAAALVYGSAGMVGPPAVAYLTGSVAAWVTRGFREPGALRTR